MKDKHLSIKEICLFGILAALMFISKIVMEALPNIHLLGMLIMTITLVFRVKALLAIYIYVFINGLYAGFATWWVPYLYIWTILWGITMLLPKKMPKGVAAVVYPIVCSMHGFAFGVLYAPAQALMFSLSFDQMLVWIAQGALMDCVHGVSNLIVGTLILPFSELMKMLMKKGYRH